MQAKVRHYNHTADYEKVVPFLLFALQACRILNPAYG